MALNIVKRRIPLEYQSRINDILSIGTNKDNFLNVGDTFQLVSNTENSIFNTNLTVSEVVDAKIVKIITSNSLRNTNEVYMEIPFYAHGNIGNQTPIPFKYGDMTFTHTGTGNSSLIVGFSNDGVNKVDAAAIQLSNVGDVEFLGVNVNWKFLHINIVNIDVGCKVSIQWDGE